MSKKILFVIAIVLTLTVAISLMALVRVPDTKVNGVISPSEGTVAGGNPVKYFGDGYAIVEFTSSISRDILHDVIVEMESKGYYPYADAWRQWSSTVGFSMIVFKKG